MNQVDYKKKYNEALERMKSWARGEHPECFTEARKAAEFIFPELAESDDEKIVQDIICCIKDLPIFFEEITINGKSKTTEEFVTKAIAWLEKQGEQKPLTQYNYVKFREGDKVQKITGDKDIVTIAEVDIEAEEYKLTNTGFIPFKYEHLWHIVEQKPVISNDAIREGIAHFGITQHQINWLKKYVDVKQCEQKPEHKFKVGDWVVLPNNETKQIEEVTFGNYWFTDKTPYNIIDVDNKGHLWAIQNAKDGDVLASHECYVIFKEIDGPNIKCYCTYHYMGFNPSFYVDTLQNKNAFYLATKEQRDLLFQKMKEAGYEWDAEKKELKKIEQKPVVIPKFRVGDKVKDNYLTYTVEDIDEDSYKLQAYSKDGHKGSTVFLTIGYEEDYELVEQKPVEWQEEQIKP